MSLLFFAVAAAGCGAGAESGGGDIDLPTRGAGPYDKLEEGMVEGSEDSPIDEPYVVLDFAPSSVACGPSPLGPDNGRYIIYYASGDASALYTIRRAAGIDLINDPTDDIEVLVPTQPWENLSVGSPSAVRASGGGILLFYQGADGGIGLARSEDGVNFTPSPANPVLVADRPEEGGFVGQPGAARWDGEYYMVYAAGQGGGLFAARSPDGEQWTKIDADPLTPELDPVLAPSDATDQFDEVGVLEPFVRISAPAGRPVFDLWFVGRSAADEHAVGFAGSFDGIFFERIPEPMLDPGNVDEREPAVVPRGSRFVMFYCQEASRMRLGVAAGLH